MKKRKIILFTFLNLIIMAAFTAALIYFTRLQDNMTITVHFGESHAGSRNIGQLFYAEDDKSFSGNSVLTEVFEQDELSFNIGTINLKNNLLRLDPFNVSTDFSITEVEIHYGNFQVWNLQGENLAGYFKKVKRVNYQVQQNIITFHGTGKDPRIIMSRKFSQKLYQFYFLFNRMPYIVLGLLFIVLGFVQVKAFSRKPEEDVGGYFIWMLIADVLIAVGVVFIYVLVYFESHFGQVPFGQLVYHLHTPLDGTDISSYYGVIAEGVALTCIICIGVFVLYVLLKRKKAHAGFAGWCTTLGLLLILYAGVQAYIHFDLAGYYQYTHSSTKLYEEHYVDGKTAAITFPEKKRNLIYIFLESMETTYANQESGGAMQDNYIPELTDLAMQNETFSGEKLLNGAYHVSGATYTMGALAAQTAGVPINENQVSNETLNGIWESENNYLPGVWSIGDVLAREGYNQEFLIGSDGAFAGRSSYFKGHGGYAVEDYPAAKQQGRIPEDYKVWWGYEDEKLFEFAKEDITRLAQNGEPFNFTMLTVDTHATDGYICDLCGDQYEEQFSNVLACSSRQAAEFVEWVKQQDFYENTTIVLAGDHLTPDSYYIATEGAEGFDRKVYFTVINPAGGKRANGQQRVYTTLDIYPTTLSALGVSIEGSRLGLGVDLYSGLPTLAEEYGLDYLNTELMKNSDYYTKKLLYK